MDGLHAPVPLYCKLRLLLWKNARLMRRHKCVSCLELIWLPLLVCILLIIVRSRRNLEDRPQREFTSDPRIIGPNHRNLVKNFKSYKLSPHVKLIYQVAYAPKLIGYDIFDVIAKKVSDYDLLFTEPPVLYNTSKELELGMLRKGYFVGLDFSRTRIPKYRNNFTSLPKHLRCDIRFPASWRTEWHKKNPAEYSWKTDRFFPPYIITPRQPTEDFDIYHTEGFTDVQLAVSIAYAEYFKGIDIYRFNLTTVANMLQTAIMRRCPYPAYKKDDYPKFFVSGCIPLLIMLLSLVSVLNTVQFIANEKETKLKVLMILMGMPNYLQWFSWLVRSIIISLLTVTLISTLLKIPITDGLAVFAYTEWIMLWMFLFTYSLSVIGFSFMMSVLFNRAKTATIVSGVVFVLTLAFGILMDKRYLSMALWEKQALSILMNTGFWFAFKVIMVWEGNGMGLSRENIWRTAPKDNLSVGMVEVMFVLEFMLYWLIALYVEQTCTDEYRIAQKWWYPVSPKYWCGGLIQKKDAVLHADNTVQEYGDNATNDQFVETNFFEPEPYQLHAGVHVHGLAKNDACKTTVVYPMFMNVYENQLTVLLGHNGCGKTAIMNMLMGLLWPTKGTALVNGQSLRSIPAFRRSVGICPLHNILFDQLTVEEHIWFFSCLKGQPESRIRNEIDEYIRLTDLNATTQSRCMSDGMKRKLSVCIALCGGSKVVFFDEPTLGMDPCARRLIYELLQQEKCGRTILMATCNKAEADLLGDRIAILANGRIQCCGSPYFLKHQLTSAYRLVCRKASNCDVDQVTALLFKHFNMVTLEKDLSTELTFVLADQGSERYAPMFDELERNAEHLGLMEFGLSTSTLEDVFTSLSTHKKNLLIYTDDVAGIHTEKTQKNILQTALVGDGNPLIYLQTFGMLRKKIIQTKRNKVLTILKIVIPIAILILYRPDPENLPSLALNFDPYEKTTTFVYYRPNVPWSSRYGEEYINGNMFAKGSKNKLVSFVKTDLKWNELNQTDWLDYTVAADFIKSEYEHDPLRANRELVGGIDLSRLNMKRKKKADETESVSLTNTSTMLYYTNQNYHSLPVNLYHGVMMGLHATVGSSFSAFVYNTPLPFTAHDREHMFFNSAMAITIGISMAFVSAIYVIPYISESKCGAKHLQFLSGVRIYIFWTTAFVWDYFIYLIAISLLMSAIAIIQDPGWTTVDDLVRMFIVLLAFGWAMLPTTYFASLTYNDTSHGFMKLSLFYVLSGVAMHLFVNLLSTKIPSSIEHSMANSLKQILLVFPHFALCRAISDSGQKDIWCRATCMMTEDCEHENICASVSECCLLKYFNWEHLGIGAPMSVMALVGPIFLALVMLAEYSEIHKNGKQKPLHNNTVVAIEDAALKPYARRLIHDVDVQTERDRVAALRCTDLKRHSLVVCHLKKVFGMSQHYAAVKGVSFIVDGGQLLSVVGKHGAGKSSLLRMLANATTISGGNAWVDSFNVRTHLKEVNKRIGYCPQSIGLIDEMTGRETIEMHCALRGIRMGEETERVTNILAHELGFVKQLDVPANRCSVGTNRKLSTAVALCGDPAVVFLDEPSNGMDANAKHCLWNTLTRVRRMGKAIVFSSENMTECELLCTNLTIMVKGLFRCFGSVHHLKSHFGTDYTLSVTVEKRVDCGPDVEAAELTQTNKQRYNMGNNNWLSSKLIEPKSPQPLPEYAQLHKFLLDQLPGAQLQHAFKAKLYYRVPQMTESPLRWSQIFAIMESARSLHLNIVDYSISETTMEEVLRKFVQSESTHTCKVCVP